MLDTIIENASIVDGTGAPPFMGSVGLKDGLIAHVGAEKGLAANRRIDAQGACLAPGFIDPHTHYDAQLAWDPYATCSPLHGVTTVTIGNCGVGVAPVRPAMRDTILHDLVNVEAIPFDVMKAGIDWQWETYGEYLDALDRNGLGINVAGLVAHTPLRHYVMGDASFERAATPGETGQMRDALLQAMKAGAFGFSTTRSQSHAGVGGKPLACRNADVNELTGLAAALKEIGCGSIEIALDSTGVNVISDAEVALLRALADAGGRPISWLSMFAHPGKADFHDQTFAKMGDLIRLAAPQISVRAIVTNCELRQPSMFAAFASWNEAFGKEMAEQVAFYRTPAFRQAFVDELARRGRQHVLTNMIVLGVRNPALQRYAGRTVGEIAKQENRRPVDVLLDIAIEDNLETQFQVAVFNYDLDGVERLVKDDRAMVGLSDGGAHCDILCDAGYSTAMLQIWVRERKVLSLQKAVQKMTQVPANFLGITDRGLVRQGLAADLVLFDPDTVAAHVPQFVKDFPAGGRRLFASASGVIMTFMNGQQLCDNGALLDTRAGKVLRSAAYQPQPH